MIVIVSQNHVKETSQLWHLKTDPLCSLKFQSHFNVDIVSHRFWSKNISIQSYVGFTKTGLN